MLLVAGNAISKNVINEEQNVTVVFRIRKLVSNCSICLWVIPRQINLLLDMTLSDFDETGYLFVIIRKKYSQGRFAIFHPVPEIRHRREFQTWQNVRLVSWLYLRWFLTYRDLQKTFLKLFERQTIFWNQIWKKQNFEFFSKIWNFENYFYSVAQC